MARPRDFERQLRWLTDETRGPRFQPDPTVERAIAELQEFALTLEDRIALLEVRVQFLEQQREAC